MNNAGLSRILVFDSQVSGHHLEYITHVADWAQKQVRCRVVLCVAEEIKAKLTGRETNTLTIISVPDTGLTFKTGRATVECKFIRSIAKENDVRRVYFLNINPYQIEVFRWRFASLEFSVLGILFGPHHRIMAHKSSTFRERLTLKLTKYRKYVQLKLMTANPIVEQIFVLDDKAGVELLNPRFNAKMVYLPDPMEKEGNAAGFIEPPWWRRLGSKRVFLIFGTLNPRKNVENSILGFVKGSNENDFLVVVGGGAPEYLQKIKTLIENLPSKASDQIIFQPGFVSVELLNGLFRRADVIMMVYKHFFGSSGILGNAARWKKPVLAGNAGLIQELAGRYNLGLCTEPTVDGIAKGIQDVDSDEYLDTFIPSPAYLEEKTIENFITTLFKFNSI